ncbi:circularly permuted type 2 ATP-grasp protein [Brachybacterium sp. J144]|uniref:circularly permuted type 2 ATP-grasp protein n=1 Tax=Brachybacterium sp. J144 TaxID=3116487 RepID=UPI002E78B14D|nr:circularly permuted type 2 ATP-grasp protein [Brachybacterium sp. J144]MEE1651567.1 circularly permuted type 2 ATP-grasp protein [Brachybacterium sp. J144]
MSITAPPVLAAELDELGAAGRRRAATSAAAMIAADVSIPPPLVDPVPVVLDVGEWEQISAGLIQRARLFDALYSDLYGPRTVLATDVAPVAELLADPAYLRPAVGIPSRGNHHLFLLSTTIARTAEGSWTVLEDAVDVPGGAGLALELRRVLSRCAPSLYSTTPLRRLHPYFDGVRTALHQRTRSGGRVGRTVVLADDADDPARAFDHSWLANLLGAPLVSAGDLRTGSGALTLRLPGGDEDPGDTVDAVLRLVPSAGLDPLDLGPSAGGGVTGLLEAARSGDVEIFNPLGAGLLENPALAAALPDLCRQILHEDLLLRPAPEDLRDGGTAAGWPSADPAGGDGLVDRPLTLQMLVIATGDGYEVLPGGVARTADAGPEALKDVWVVPAETSVPGTAGNPGDETADPAPRVLPAIDTAEDPAGLLSAYPAMTRSIGSDLFWFGRYLERVDLTARMLRTVLDTVNDLSSERSPSARQTQSVLLRAVTDVTTTYPGFAAIDGASPSAIRREVRSLLTEVGRPGSLAQSYVALAHTTRTLRDLITDDVWPVIASMRARLAVLDGHDLQPVEQALTEVVDGCLTLSGAVSDSMPRNLGWDLTEAGRRIERSLALLALLRATLGRRRPRAVETRLARTVALITESGAAYRRAYHAAVRPELLLELLLADTTLPRSIAFQIERLSAALDRLPEGTPALELRAPLTSLRTRLAGWHAHDLLQPAEDAGAGPDGTPTPLLTEIDGAIASLRELATALENRFFRPSESTSRWGVDDV